jgi:predicted phosphodiesterase
MQEAKKVRIVTMSDTHDVHFRIDIKSLPPADIFIHGGDFTKFSTAPELARFR